MKRRILVISPAPTHPQESGNKSRIFQMLNQLKKMGHDIFFLHINEDRFGNNYLMREYWGDRFLKLDYRSPLERSQQGGRVSQRPRLEDWYDPDLDRPLKKLAKQIRPDTVLVEYAAYSKALEHFNGDTLKMIDTHDVFTNREERLIQEGVPRLSPTGWYSGTREEETRALNRADRVIAIQNEDKKYFESVTSKPVVTVGHFTPLQPNFQSRARGRMITFVGNLCPPNVHAVNYLTQQIIPRVKARIPDTPFLLVGRICDYFPGKTEACIKLGRVKEIEEIYRLSDIVVNPVLYSTGLHIKLIEALGHARPVVTTSIGARGFSEGKGDAFLVADTPDEFAEAVVELLSNPTLFQRLSKGAYQFAETYNQKTLESLTSLFE